MGMEQTFEVLTEFNFDVSSALLGTGKLEQAIGGISQAADEAMGALERLGLGLFAKLGLGGGILASLAKAVGISEEFRHSQAAFAGLLTTNMKYLTGSVGTFNERLQVSEVIMRNIAGMAQRFGFDESDFMKATQATAQTLMPLGAAGKNFQGAANLTSGAFLAAPMLGMTGSDAQKQVAELMNPSESSANALFKALQGTPAMKGMGLDKFDDMGARAKVDLLNKAMGQFAKQTGAANFQLDSIANQFTRLKAQFFSPIIGMFRGVGDELRKYVVEFLQVLNAYVDGPGREIFKNLLGAFKMFTKDGLEPMLVSFMQLRNLKSDAEKASTATTLLGVIFEVATGFALLKRVFPNLGGGLQRLVGWLGPKLAEGLRWIGKGVSELLGPLMTWKNALWVLRTTFTVLRYVLMEMLLPFTIMLAMFQGWSRAQAKNQIADKKFFAMEVAPQLSELMGRVSAALKNLFHPFQALVDAFSNAFQLLHHTGGKWGMILPVLRGTVWLVEKLGKAMVLMMGIFEASVNAIMSSVFLLKNLGIKALVNGDFYRAIGQGFRDDVGEYMKKNLARIDKGDLSIQQTNNFTGDVHIHNDFKENAQPDRIAFTLKEQILKAHTNPTQAKKRSFSRAGNF